MSSDGNSRSRWLGFRRAALLEMAVLFVAALCADFFLFHADRFWSVSPHPFWAIVLLMSVQYGSAEGLLAAALYSVALLAFNLPEPFLGEDRYTAFLELSRLPILWFVAAVVLGELRRRQSARESRLRVKMAESDTREAALRDICGKLGAAKDHLESRVAGQPATVLELCRAAQKLERLDPDQALQGAMEIVRASLRPRKFSVFIRRGGALELAHQEGWSGNDPWSRSLAKSSPLARAMLEERRILCVAVPGDEVPLGGEGLIAGSLRDPATGMMLGMLKIEAWDFYDLHSTQIRTFEAVADWIAGVYAQAHLHQALLGRLAATPAVPMADSPAPDPDAPILSSDDRPA